MKNSRNNKMKASPPAKTIALHNKIVPIQTRPDRRDELRKNIDPKRYANPDTPDGRWPRHTV